MVDRRLHKRSMADVKHPVPGVERRRRDPRSGICTERGRRPACRLAQFLPRFGLGAASSEDDRCALAQPVVWLGFVDREMASERLVQMREVEGGWEALERDSRARAV